MLGSLSSSSKPFNKSTLPGSTTGSNFCEKWTINTSDSNRAPVRHNQSHITEQLHSPQQQRKKQRVDNYFIKNPPKSSHFPFNFLGTSSSSFVTGFNIFTNFWTADDDDVRIIGGATGNTQSWYPNSSSS